MWTLSHDSDSARAFGWSDRTVPLLWKHHHISAPDGGRGPSYVFEWSFESASGTSDADVWSACGGPSSCGLGPDQPAASARSAVAGTRGDHLAAIAKPPVVFATQPSGSAVSARPGGTIGTLSRSERRHGHQSAVPEASACPGSAALQRHSAMDRTASH